MDLDTLYKALFVGASTWDPEQDFDEKTGFGRVDAYDALKYRDQNYNIARIYDPLNGYTFYRNLHERFSVIGTALAKNFVCYELCINDNCEHIAISYPGDGNQNQRIRETLGEVDLLQLSEGDYTLTLNVWKTIGGGGQGFGMEGIPGPPIPQPPICRSHQIEFTWANNPNEVVPELKPDLPVTIDSTGNQLAYSIQVFNYTDSVTTFKYQIDYDYVDSNYLFLGPYEASLNPNAFFEYVPLLSSTFTDEDSLGTYIWNLRILDLNNEPISKDTLVVIKE